MKQDEYDLLLGNPVTLNSKRKAYILRKWERKEWLLNGSFTPRFLEIREAAKNKVDRIQALDGKVVIVHYVGDGMSECMGILEDHGDNGWYFYTRYTVYFLACYEVAYVEPHPKPAKLWRTLNYLYWRREGTEERFHQKITNGSYETTCDYTKVAEGIFSYSNPHGKIGDCFPWCQCKVLS